MKKTGAFPDHEGGSADTLVAVLRGQSNGTSDEVTKYRTSTWIGVDLDLPFPNR